MYMCVLLTGAPVSPLTYEDDGDMQRVTAGRPNVWRSREEVGLTKMFRQRGRSDTEHAVLHLRENPHHCARQAAGGRRRFFVVRMLPAVCFETKHSVHKKPFTAGLLSRVEMV